MGDTDRGELQRHFGLLQATALNVPMIVGAGVFITIPYMLKELPGPYALLGWLAAGALMLVDGMIWSELAAALPGWLYMYLTAGLLFIAIGLVTLSVGVGVFFVWTWWTRRWPFAAT